MKRSKLLVYVFETLRLKDYSGSYVHITCMTSESIGSKSLSIKYKGSHQTY